MIIRIIKNIFLVSFLIIGTLLAEDKILSLPKVTVEYVTNTVFQTGILDIRTRTFHAKNLKRIEIVENPLKALLKSPLDPLKKFERLEIFEEI